MHHQNKRKIKEEIIQMNIASHQKQKTNRTPIYIGMLFFVFSLSINSYSVGGGVCCITEEVSCMSVQPSSLLVEVSSLLAQPSSLLAEVSSLLAQPSSLLAEVSSLLAQPSSLLAQSSSLLAQPSSLLAQPSSLLAEVSSRHKTGNIIYSVITFKASISQGIHPAERYKLPLPNV